MDWKKAGNYALYVIPGYGVYDQVFRKHKGERSPLGVIGSGIYTAGFLIKVALLPAYLGKGVTTGNWNPFKFNSKDKIERVENMQEDNLRGIKDKALEKSVMYHDLLK